MCGLFGVMSTFLSKAELQTFEQLGYLSVFRGGHATGIAGAFRSHEVNRRKEYKYDSIKATMPAYDFFNQEKVGEFLNGKGKVKVALIGHTRYATVGEHTAQHAHPHKFKHILGSHNGTIHRLTWQEEHKKLGTDSRALFNLIAEKGIKHALTEAHYGAYAISYFDTSNNTLNFARNKDRPLYFMYTKGHTTVYWASEERFLEFVSKGSRDVEPIFMLNTGILYQFPMGKPEEAKVIDLDLKPPVNVVHYNPPKHKGKFSIPGWWGGGDWEEKRQGKVIDLLPGPSKETKDSWDKLSYKSYNNEVITIAEALMLLESGCSYCGTPKDLDDKAYWIGRGEFVCSDCATDEFVQQYLNMDSNLGEIIEHPSTTPEHLI